MPRRKKEDELPPDQKGPPRGAANARERTRMRVLSKAFGRLKLTLPWVPPDTKLSKLDTLRLATSYISHLQVLIESDEEDNEGSDNDNEKLKIDSSVRTRQLTSLRCWPYGQSRLLSSSLAPNVAKTTTTTQRHINGNNTSSINSTLVTSTSLTGSATTNLLTDSSQCPGFRPNSKGNLELNKSKETGLVENSVETAGVSNAVQCNPGTSSHFVSSNDNYAKIQENRNMNQDCINDIENNTKHDVNVSLGNNAPQPSLNNNINSRVFEEQQNITTSYKEDSNLTRSNNEGSLSHSNYINSKAMESYEYSIMYRQNAQEIKYRDDYNTASSRIQYY